MDQIPVYRDLPLFRSVIDAVPRRRTSKLQKQQAQEDFLRAFKNNEAVEMIRLVKEFPFLKTVRFTDPYLLGRIEKKDLNWCPKGWSPAQIASYIRDIELLNFVVIELGMDIRSMKAPGGETVESNPLHIAIRKDFKVGAKSLLDYVGLQSFGFVRNRFVDEKDHLKRTPWFLAVEKDLANRRIRYISLVGRYGPSGYVKSYTFNGVKDGYEIAYATGEDTIIARAHRFLIAPKYDHYREIERESRRPRLRPPR